MLSENRHQARGGPCGELTRRDQFAEFSPIWPVLGRTTEIRRARIPVMSILVAGEGLVFHYRLIIRDRTAGMRCREAVSASDIGYELDVLLGS